MFDIDAKALRDQAAHISSTYFYLSVHLVDDANPELIETLNKQLYQVGKWEFEEATKAKWYARAFVKPVEHYNAVLKVYNNGLVHYSLYASHGNKVACSAKTISNIFHISISDCYVTGINGNDETKFNGVLTSVFVGLNNKKI